jgi:tetratricopeptide (TPR) repeat protein
MRRVLAACLAVFSIAAAAPPHALHKALPKPPPKPPIEQLFAQLAQAQSPEDAKPIEDRIAALFEQSGSASIDLLMARGSAALAAGDEETAKKLFDTVTYLAPRYAEGWHQKAQLEVEGGNDEAAMISLQKTITLNPRHFEALSQLGDMLEEYGRKDGALQMYKRALALDPQLEGAAKHAHELEKAVEGQGI